MPARPTSGKAGGKKDSAGGKKGKNKGAKVGVVDPHQEQIDGLIREREEIRSKLNLVCTKIMENVNLDDYKNDIDISKQQPSDIPIDIIYSMIDQICYYRVAFLNLFQETDDSEKISVQKKITQLSLDDPDLFRKQLTAYQRLTFVARERDVWKENAYLLQDMYKTIVDQVEMETFQKPSVKSEEILKSSRLNLEDICFIFSLPRILSINDAQKLRTKKPSNDLHDSNTSADHIQQQENSDDPSSKSQLSNQNERRNHSSSAARISALSFLYDNILAEFFSGIVTNTFTTATNALNNLIQTNPLNLGKREVEGDLAARISALSFLYDNILAEFFSGIVTNTFTTATNALNNLIQTNPLNLGKREVEGDLAARISALSFLYDNILAEFFSGIVTNTFTTATNALNNLIQTNPLNLGKRAEPINISIFQFLYDNVVADLFGGLASNTANYLQNTLNNLLNKPFANIGKRSVEIQQAQTLIAQTVSTLIATFKTFAQQAVASLNDRQKFSELVKENIAFIKTTVAALAQQLSQLIPSAIATEISEVLAMLQSVLVFWTSGLAGSLGPVLGAFRP
ncbi:hypothetical protein I4U23_029767 [Adineta vaga]|nr:hypothetical protein I4U23_029767 [Adineta vaga]